MQNTFLHDQAQNIIDLIKSSPIHDLDVIQDDNIDEILCFSFETQFNDIELNGFIQFEIDDANPKAILAHIQSKYTEDKPLFSGPIYNGYFIDKQSPLLFNTESVFKFINDEMTRLHTKWENLKNTIYPQHK